MFLKNFSQLATTILDVIGYFLTELDKIRQCPEMSAGRGFRSSLVVIGRSL